MAAYAAVQKSRASSVGTGEAIIRWVSSIAAAPAIGLLTDAMRKMASRPMGSASPKA